MRFRPLELQGAYLIEQERHSDERGYFARAWCTDELSEQGLCGDVVQVNVGFSLVPGTLRGLHIQSPPHSEVKLIRCTRGRIYDVILDLRPASPTFCQWVGMELDAADGRAIYAPEGFAHGYQTLSPESEMMYFTSRRFTPASATGVRFDDPRFSIRWPLEIASISDADSSWPDFDANHPLLQRSGED